MEPSPEDPPLREPEVAEVAQRGFRYALALTHDRARAEDLVHDALVSILRSKGPWSAPYLFTVIRSRFVDQRRREESVPMESLEGVDEARIAALLDCEEHPVDEEALARALGRLRPEEREVLLLACVEDLTCAQIAEIFGRPRGSITSLLHRAQQKLRQLVLRAPSEPSP